MRNREKVWIICFEYSKQALEHTMQMLSKMRDMHSHEVSTNITTIVFERIPVEVCHAMYLYGATDILALCFGETGEASRTAMLVAAIAQHRPKLLLFPTSLEGRACAAEVAAATGAGLTADCTNIAMHGDGQYMFTRTALNASVIADILCQNTSIAMCTVKKNAFAKKAAYNCIEQYDEMVFMGEMYRAKASIVVVERLPAKIQQTNALENAPLVMAFGRGASDPETLALLHEVALRIGAEIAGTRAVVEEGLIERERQVGQSGITVRPRLYIAWGISGATQHIIGMQNAAVVVAVNKDVHAPIFQYADYAIVDDCRSVLQALNFLL